MRPPRPDIEVADAPRVVDGSLLGTLERFLGWVIYAFGVGILLGTLLSLLWEIPNIYATVRALHGYGSLGSAVCTLPLAIVYVAVGETLALFVLGAGGRILDPELERRLPLESAQSVALPSRGRLLFVKKDARARRAERYSRFTV